MAIDVLTAFIDKYYRCLNLKPRLNNYDISEISYGIQNYLFGLCAGYIKATIPSATGFINLDLDKVNVYLMRYSLSPIPLSSAPFRFSLGADRTSMKSVVESLDYLLANSVSEITRVFPSRTYSLPNGGWMWSGYSREDELKGVTNILGNVENEFKDFLAWNNFRFAKNNYLDPGLATIYEYIPAFSDVNDESPFSKGCPTLHMYIVANPKGELPKTTLIILEHNNPIMISDDLKTITIASKQYYLAYWKEMTADFFFHPLPLLRVVYGMLCDELEANYPIGNTFGFFSNWD